MTFRFMNFNKPTPQKWRDFGDALLVVGLLSPTVASLPLTDNAKIWTMAVVNTIVIIGKFITKLFHDENHPEQ